jgi:hypothetical protein
MLTNKRCSLIEIENAPENPTKKATTKNLHKLANPQGYVLNK